MTACPPDETLLDLLRGDLPAGSASAIRVHVEACDSCLDVLDRLSDDPDLDVWMESGLGDGGAIARRAVLEGLGPIPPIRADEPRSLGAYEIEAEIGRGGMGVVYRARDRTIGRVVALKVLRPDLDDDRARRRFVREVRAAAAVEHDHIVRVYATSDPSEPLLYFAMEYVAGPSLAERIRAGGRLDPREAADLVAQAAEGLAAAHAAGLVHRDVKPDNILIDAATGRAKVGDFGLARLAAEVSDLTRSGVVAGTPAYLSPEQARGESDAGPSADVYGLGATLYECLTGEVPFRGAPHMVVQQILADEPRPPRRLNDAIPRDLETICLKALAKEPHRRYPAAAALAEDLRRWGRGEPIRARPAGRAERLWRLARRRPLAVSLALALALALIAGTTASLLLWRRAEAHLKDAERSFRQAHEAVDKYYVKLYTSGVLNGPGLESVRSEIIHDALAYYRDFVAQRAGDPALRAEAAEAALRAGLIFVDGGDKHDGLDFLGQARPLLERLARDRPGDLAVRRKLGQCHDMTGCMLQRVGRFPEAVEAHRRAADVYRGMVATDPETPMWRRLLGHSLGNLANTYSIGRMRSESARAYGQAREQIDALLRLDPSDAGYRSDLAMTLNNMAMVSGPADRPALHREALALREALLAERPGDDYVRRNVARSRNYVGNDCAEVGRRDEALRLLDGACDSLRQIVRGNHLASFRHDLASACLDRANILLDLGRPSESLAAAIEGREILVDITRLDPENVPFRRDLALVHLASARAHERLGHIGEALGARLARLPVLERITRDNPDDTEAAADLADERKAVAAILDRAVGAIRWY